MRKGMCLSPSCEGCYVEKKVGVEWFENKDEGIGRILARLMDDELMALMSLLVTFILSAMNLQVAHISL